MENNNPEISVIMSVYNAKHFKVLPSEAKHGSYNGEKYLKEAIESILNQSFKNFEFLIVNDGSTDKTPEILKEYAKKDSRIKVIINSKNIGLTKSLNKAIKQAKGKYIARMDADDISLKERLKKEFNFLEKHPDIALVGTFEKNVNPEGKVIGEHRPFIDYEKIKKAQFFSNQFSHGTIMIRKKVIESLNYYNERFIYSQDYELWLRLINRFKALNIPEFLSICRRHPKTIGAKKKNEQRKFLNQAKIEAIKKGQYPAYWLLFIIWPYISFIIPKRIKDFLKTKK